MPPVMCVSSLCARWSPLWGRRRSWPPPNWSGCALPCRRKPVCGPRFPRAGTPEPEAQAQTKDGLFTGEMLSQLHTVFDRMASPLILRLCLDETPVSAELEHYMQELAAQSDKLSVEQGRSVQSPASSPVFRSAAPTAAGQVWPFTACPADMSLPPLSWGSTMRPGQARFWMRRPRRPSGPSGSRWNFRFWCPYLVPCARSW